MNGRGIMALGRHLIWGVAAFVVFGALVTIRREVADLRERLDRSGRELESAEVLNGRLSAELDARRRAANMQVRAGELGLVRPRHVVDLGEGG